MKIDVNGETEDLSAMLIGAERYALGRKTYIVQWTCEFIGSNLHLLTEKDKQVMIRDIENPKRVLDAVIRNIKKGEENR